MVRFVIGPGGDVIQVARLAGPEPFVDSLAQAVRSWRFAPSRRAATALAGATFVPNHDEAAVRLTRASPIARLPNIQANIKGAAVLQIDIDPTGRVSTATFISGEGAVKELAVRTALGWRYEPQVMPYSLRVAINFF